MHLVFLNQYYPPDVAPTGVMLAAVVEELAAQGHEVTVICAAGGYAGAQSTSHHPQSPVRVLRIRATRFGRGTFSGKVFDYLSYYLGVAWRLAWMTPKPGRIVALTTPPYLSVLARAMSKLRRADHAHWVMDLYPDVMVAHGMLGEGGAAHRILAGLARWGFGGKRAATLLTLGPDMAERIKCLMDGTAAGVADQHPAAPDEVGRMDRCNPTWIPLWSEGDEDGAVDCTAAARRRQEMGWKIDELVVMYSGNMGLGHRFKEILEVADQGAVPQSRFVFFGGGKRRGEIAEFIARQPGAPVELHDYVRTEILAAHLRSADVHLASLDAQWTGTMLPSKLQGIFTAGRPVIFIGDPRSSIGRWIIESGGGQVVKPGDAAGLAAAINETRDPQVRDSQGSAAKAFSKLNFHRQANVRRVAELLTSDGFASHG